MVTFITLFLSLIAGEQPIRVAVGDNVAQVEFRLDNEVIGVLTKEPWSLTHDFGDLLSPRELVAIAYDVSGKEVGRARLLINVPRPRAGAALQVREVGEDLRAKLSWETVGGSQPEAISFELDGKPLEVSTPLEFSLPNLDLRDLHFITAEVVFPDEVVARAWTSFGGQFLGQMDAELTAVTVLSRRANTKLTTEKIADWFQQNGEPLSVVATEKGPAEILMIRAQEAYDPLMRMGNAYSLQNTSAGELTGGFFTTLPRSLDEGDRFNILATWPKHSRKHNTTASLFPMLIRDPRVSREGIPKILTQLFPPVPSVATHRISDAVAAAGRAAATNSRPRAVILVLNGEPTDSSFHSPRNVRSYLGDLGVPLWVWNITGRSLQPKPKSWGTVLDVSTASGLKNALTKLRSHLDRQRVVWLEGSHLPQSLELSAAAKKKLQLVN